MTTNETPYRPQVGDMAEFNTQRGTGVISAIIGSKAQLYCDGVWVKVDMSDLQLISRADGVPVEPNAREKAQQEHAAEVAELRQHLQSWIKNKDALVAAANKMAGEELDRRFATDDVVSDLRQRLERAVQIATESRQFIDDIVPGCAAGHDILSSLKQRIDAFLAAESQRTTDGEAT